MRTPTYSQRRNRENTKNAGYECVPHTRDAATGCASVRSIYAIYANNDDVVDGAKSV